MRQVKLVNGLLWAFNILLGVGIVIFAFNFLLLPKPPDDLGLEDPGEGPPPQTAAKADYGVLRNLQNPILKGAGATTDVAYSGSFNPKFFGGWHPLAILQIGGKDALAEIGKPITVTDEAGEERAIPNWQLVSFNDDSAVFTDGTRQLVVRRDEAGTGTIGPVSMGGRRNQAGAPYDPSNFKSRLRPGTKENGRPIYEIDSEEAQWAQQNIDAVLQNDVKLAVSGEGGLQITEVTPGSIAESRGISANDIVKSVNGEQIRSLADLDRIKTKLSGSKQNSMTLEISHAGRPVWITYQIMPKGR